MLHLLALADFLHFELMALLHSLDLTVLSFLRFFLMEMTLLSVLLDSPLLRLVCLVLLEELDSLVHEFSFV